MAESWRSRVARWRINWFPAYRGTGGRVEYISADCRDVRVAVEKTIHMRRRGGPKDA